MLRTITLLSTLFILFCIISPSNAKALQSGYGLDDTVKDLLPSVVLIVGIGDKVTLGSGFIIDEEGSLVTNQHVIDKADEIYAIWDSTVGRAFEKCTVAYSNDKLDIALLKLPGTGYTPIDIARPDEADIADDIICLGFPIVDSKDFRNDTFNVAVTRGIISSMQRDTAGEIIEIWTDAAITYGNSGGPLYDVDLGGVIGINNLFAPETHGNYNLAIPINRFQDAIAGRQPTPVEIPNLEVEETPEIPEPVNPSQVLEDAIKLYKTGDHRRAIRDLEQAIDSTTAEEAKDICLQLGEWYIADEHYGKAYWLYKDFETYFAGDDDFRVDYGVLAYRAGEYNRAVEILLPYITSNKEMVYLALALSYLELGSMTEAKTYAELTLKVATSEEVIGLAKDILTKVRDATG